MEKAPVFVKIEDYKDFDKLFDKLSKKLREARELFSQILEIQHQENTEAETWAKELEDVKERLARFDEALAEPEI